MVHSNTESPTSNSSSRPQSPFPPHSNHPAKLLFNRSLPEKKNVLGDLNIKHIPAPIESRVTLCKCRGNVLLPAPTPPVHSARKIYINISCSIRCIYDPNNHLESHGLSLWLKIKVPFMKRPTPLYVLVWSVTDSRFTHSGHRTNG